MRTTTEKLMAVDYRLLLTKQLATVDTESHRPGLENKHLQHPPSLSVVGQNVVDNLVVPP